MVNAAIERDGLALQWAGETCQKDGQTALKAVSKNGLALQFVNKSLQYGIYGYIVVHAAVTQNGNALKFAIPMWQQNRRILDAAAAQLATRITLKS